MPHYDPLTGHTTSPHAHDYEDGDERPLPSYPTPARPPQFTTDEVFSWVCQRQQVNPRRLSEARYRSLRTIAESAARKLNTLFAGSLT